MAASKELFYKYKQNIFPKQYSNTTKKLIAF